MIRHVDDRIKRSDMTLVNDVEARQTLTRVPTLISPSQITSTCSSALIAPRPRPERFRYRSGSAMSPNLALKLKNIQDHPHAKLLFIWSALDLILLSSGVITVIASICFHRPRQLIINLIFDDLHYIGMSRSLFFLFSSIQKEVWIWRNEQRGRGSGKVGSGRVLMTGGLILGSAYVTATILSIPAILLGRNRLWGLKTLNWGLVILVFATLLVSPIPIKSDQEQAADGQFASWIWFFSLRQLQELCDIREAQPALIQQAIQDQVRPLQC